jgi:quinol monooxygenase YgiN
MPVVRMGKMKGDPSELASSYDSVQERMGQPPPGLLAHIAARTDYGFTVINVWESEEQSEAAWNRPEFQQALQEAGISPELSPYYQVQNFQSHGS